MKKTAFILTGVTGVLGLIAALLHTVEINTVLDPSSGLAERFAPISICTAAVTGLSAVIIFALTLIIKGRNAEPVYHLAFAQKTPICIIISFLSAAAMLLGAYFCTKNGVGIRSSDTLVLILSFFAAMSGISSFVLRLISRLNKSGAEAMLCSFINVLFLCLWLVVYYLEKSADPAMISYVYDFLAICTAAISEYYSAGYAFGRSSPMATLFFSMLSAFFCISVIPTAFTVSFKIFFAAVALHTLCNVFLLSNNLKCENEQ